MDLTMANVTGISNLTLGRKMIQLCISVVFLTIITATICMEATHGPLTPNGNRYYHKFSLELVNWVTVLLCVAAYILLLLPWWKLCFAEERNLYKSGIFPSTTVAGRIISSFLTLWSIVSGGAYTLMYCNYSYTYIVRHGAMLDIDEPAIMMAYIGCIVFWGWVYCMYKITFKAKW